MRLRAIVRGRQGRPRVKDLDRRCRKCQSAPPALGFARHDGEDVDPGGRSNLSVQGIFPTTLAAIRVRSAGSHNRVVGTCVKAMRAVSAAGLGATTCFSSTSVTIVNSNLPTSSSSPTPLALSSGRVPHQLGPDSTRRLLSYRWASSCVASASDCSGEGLGADRRARAQAYGSADAPGLASTTRVAAGAQAARLMIRPAYARRGMGRFVYWMNTSLDLCHRAHRRRGRRQRVASRRRGAPPGVQRTARPACR